MAIGTNAAVWFFGTEDTVDDGSTQAISNAAFSVDVATWTNDDDAPQASFVLTFQFPSGTITTGGIHLYARLLNTNSTTDAPVPSTTYLSRYIGSFATAATAGSMVATTDYAIQTGPVDLPLMKTSQEYEFYLQNSCGVTMSAGWTLKITPMALGPHA
jgi:hypothetical protein